MKINHVIPSIDLSTGGPARSVTHLINSISAQNICDQIELNTLSSLDPIIKKFDFEKASILFHNSKYFGISKSLSKRLSFVSADLFHGHGLWEYPVHSMSKIALKRHIPYIITLRGMLEPWTLKQGALKKQIALSLYQKKDLNNADCIHVTGLMEFQNFRNLGYKNPIAVIPNGINIEDFFSDKPKKKKNPKEILFLSRIHKKKGIENLINAWSMIDKKIKKDWKINIVGNGELGYINMLKSMIYKAGMIDEIFIKKPVYGKDKIKLFREASLFVLPTFSENFGIVIAEALASFTPVITTKGTPWDKLHKTNSGWWISVGVEPLKLALENALTIDEKKLYKMGLNGRNLVEKEFSMQVVATKMIVLYDWLINNNRKPNFVHIT